MKKQYNKDSCKKNDILETFSLGGSAFAFVRIRRIRKYISKQFPREYLASSLCRFQERRERRSNVRKRLGRKKNRFINSIRFPLHFSSVLQLSPSPLVPQNNPSFRRASIRTNPAYSLDPVPFRFSLSRPISAEDIRLAIRAQNLNKTNQYSNPPLSLADSPSVPFSAFFIVFFPSFFIYFYSFLFLAALPTSPSRSLSRLLRSFIHWYNIEASHLFASLCRIRRSPFQTFSTSVLIEFQQLE